MTRRKRQRPDVDYTHYFSPSPKRRRKTNLAPPRVSDTSTTSNKEEEQTEYPARAILRERIRRRRIEYLVDWVSKDGKDYPPSWEPATYINKPLLDEWKRKNAKYLPNKDSPSGKGAGSSPRWASSEQRKLDRLRWGDHFSPPGHLSALESGRTGVDATGDRDSSASRVTTPSRQPQPKFVATRLWTPVETESDNDNPLRSFTPSVAQSSISSADDISLGTAGFEIKETQQQPSTHAHVAIDVPHPDIASSQYQSITSSQIETQLQDRNSPSNSQSHPRPSLSQLAQSSVSSHSRLANVINSRSFEPSEAFQAQDSIEVPNSSQANRAKARGEVQPTTSSVIQESSGVSRREVPSSSQLDWVSAAESQAIAPVGQSQSRQESVPVVVERAVEEHTSHPVPNSPDLKRKALQSGEYHLSLKQLNPPIPRGDQHPPLSRDPPVTASSASSSRASLQAPELLTKAQALLQGFAADRSDKDLHSIELEQSPSSAFSTPLRTQLRPQSPKSSQFGSKRRSLQGLKRSFLESVQLVSKQGPIPPTSIKMEPQAARSSPRLKAATPVARARSPQGKNTLRRSRTPMVSDHPDGSVNSAAVSQNADVPMGLDTAIDSRPNTLPAQSRGLMGPSLADPVVAQEPSSYPMSFDPSLGASALPIQQSIEEEPSSSTEEHASIASKASSSQVSLQNERIVPQIDGVSLPLLPVLGESEYTIGLPAEGKVQSAYMDMINARKKTILKFISRRDSVGSANGSTARTLERNEMIELVERLHDTATHFDLGLPDLATQYSIKSEEALRYAQYAGSKFVLLGYLVDTLQRVDMTLIIASKPGAVQDLVADFLHMKHVHVQRHDRPVSARSKTPDIHQATLKVDLISTFSDHEISVSPRPVAIVAFDSTFDNQDPQIRRIRELNSSGRDRILPVVHLLVTNSSEHIDRCLRKAMPSPQRLKLLLRATFQARSHLGEPTTYVPDPSDAVEGEPLDLHALQRAVRKSPDRRLRLIANVLARTMIADDFDESWIQCQLGAIPEVQYDEMEDTPPKISGTTTTTGTAAPTPRDGRARSRTPLSGTGTPSGRKRLLEAEIFSDALTKRQRLTPLHDLTPVPEPKKEAAEIEHLREQLRTLTTELAEEKEARITAEVERDETRKRFNEWIDSHSGLMRRYERRSAQCRSLDKEKKKLESSIEVARTRQERTDTENSKLKEQVSQLKSGLTAAREDLTDAGGDVAALEEARSEARTATAKAKTLETSLGNARRDFEFTREQYQVASNKAAELAGQVNELEEKNEILTKQASDEKRRLLELNKQAAESKHLAEVNRLEQERITDEALMKKLKDENAILKKSRTGVQTRGSSVQPPGSPGIGMSMGFATQGSRSRQASPAPGVVLSASRDARESAMGVAGGHGHASGRDRVSGLRNER